MLYRNKIKKHKRTIARNWVMVPYVRSIRTSNHQHLLYHQCSEYCAC